MKHLLHVEKSGPAFAATYTQSQAHDIDLDAQRFAISHVLFAIRRRVLADLVPAWTRLLTVQGVTAPTVLNEAVLVPQWDHLLDDVIAALGGDGPLAWQRPDRVIRQMAREEAERSQRDLMGLTREWLASENGTSLRESLRQSMGTVTNNIAALRAFAEGK